ncbi:MAG: hypothetical protein U0N72_09565 [Dialister invisus]
MYLFIGCAGIAALAAQGVQPLVRNEVTQAPGLLMLSAVRGRLRRTHDTWSSDYV